MKINIFDETTEFSAFQRQLKVLSSPEQNRGSGCSSGFVEKISCVAAAGTSKLKCP